MNYYQEKIENDAIIPAKIYIKKSKGGNCRYPVHWHKNIEFDLVLEGVINGEINRNKVQVLEGEFFFVNSGELHETDAQNRNEMCSVTILLSYNLLKEYCSDIDLYYFDFTGNKVAQEKVKNFIIKCAELYEKKEEFYELDISICLRQICSVLLKECKKKKDVVYYSRYEEKSVQNIKKVITYMEENYENLISLQHIAAEIGMTPNYFCRFFKKTTGETFYKYLNEIRLYHAHKEIVNNDTSITEIALNNGFPNVKSFIEAFKKSYKVTPAKYRSQFQIS